MTEIYDHSFVGKREWGINAPLDAPCQFPMDFQPNGSDEPPRLTPKTVCGYPSHLHKTKCPSGLIIKGESFPCDVGAPHDGWAHANKAAQAIWGEGGSNVDVRTWREVHAEDPVFEPTPDPVQPLVDFMRWCGTDAFGEYDGSFGQPSTMRTTAETYCKLKGIIE